MICRIDITVQIERPQALNRLNCMFWRLTTLISSLTSSAR